MTMIVYKINYDNNDRFIIIIQVCDEDVLVEHEVEIVEEAIKSSKSSVFNLYNYTPLAHCMYTITQLHFVLH